MKLLLAEDEKELSHATITLLKMNGFDADAAYDGLEAIELAEKNIYDGYILDIMMPKADGITVLKKLRESGDTAPVLMLTAKSEIDDKVNGLNCGANDYLTKPYAIKELVARIQAMLRSSNQMPSSDITAGNFKISKSNMTLITDISSVSLTAQEFCLLEQFIVHKQHNFTARQLLEKAWDEQKDINIIPIYIAYINNKLHSVQANAEIKQCESDTYKLEIV
ncbi:MAG: response regulator transcription factor [Clostridiales bacterium]|nr:response regulator transcription factor [Clostridiales bacterium]